ncbi:hypothetical protein HMPREF9081_1895 [Centipeda periodontii DSM 2778]|uniref:Uncharacterized protein n=1 Tax=Centipeda periodontii DSM 2778 TaxID=888060 RepID=F5RNS4_9FIRM|nr:hypothetical protein HMPREF9081_1895 [Centipeda periodontii DSM 2778]
MRGATLLCVCVTASKTVSIHAPRAGRDKDIQKLERVMSVSIHAPRAGRDKIGQFL